MKLKNLNLKFLWQRGEIATILTLISVGLMLAGILAGTKIAEVSTEQRTQAQNAAIRAQSSPLSGCQIVDTDNGPGCWCQQGDWQFHCFAGAERGTSPSALCVQNCSSCNGKTAEQCKAGTGGSPPAGGGTPPPGGGNCNLNSTYLTDSVGDCGTCILDTAGNRDFFSGFPCTDGQKASYWCNGGVSGGTKPEEGQSCQNYKTQCISANKCTGKPIASPSPTGTDDKGGGGVGGTPGPGGGGGSTDITPYEHGYYVIKGEISNIDQIDNNPYIDLQKIFFQANNSEVQLKTDPSYQKQYSVVPRSIDNYDSVNNVHHYSYQYGTQNDNFIIAPIVQPIAPAANTVGTLFFLDNMNKLLDYNTSQLSICYPYGKYVGKPSDPKKSDSPTIVPTAIPEDEKTIDYVMTHCSSFINTADFDASEYITPTPAKLKFSIYTHNKIGGNTQLSVKINILNVNDINNSNTDLFTAEDDIPLLAINGSTYPATTTDSLKSNTDEIEIDISATLLEKQESSESEYKNLGVCKNNDDFPIKLKEELTNKTNDLGKLIDIIVKVTITQDGEGKDVYTYSCDINPTADSSRTFRGSANVDFDQAMDKWKSGEIDATEMSSFISQLTRTPGLQVSFCDPVKGECSPVF